MFKFFLYIFIGISLITTFPIITIQLINYKRLYGFSINVKPYREQIVGIFRNDGLEYYKYL